MKGKNISNPSTDILSPSLFLMTISALLLNSFFPTVVPEFIIAGIIAVSSIIASIFYLYRVRSLQDSTVTPVSDTLVTLGGLYLGLSLILGVFELILLPVGYSIALIGGGILGRILLLDRVLLTLVYALEDLFTALFRWFSRSILQAFRGIFLVTTFASFLLSPELQLLGISLSLGSFFLLGFVQGEMVGRTMSYIMIGSFILTLLFGLSLTFPLPGLAILYLASCIGLHQLGIDRTKAVLRWVLKLIPRIWAALVREVSKVVNYIRENPVLTLRVLSFIAVFPSLIFLNPSPVIGIVGLNVIAGFIFAFLAFLPNIINALKAVGTWIISVLQSVVTFIRDNPIRGMQYIALVLVIPSAIILPSEPEPSLSGLSPNLVVAASFLIIAFLPELVRLFRSFGIWVRGLFVDFYKFLGRTFTSTLDYIRRYPVRSTQYLLFVSAFPSYRFLPPSTSILTFPLNQFTALSLIILSILPSLVSYLLQFGPIIYDAILRFVSYLGDKLMAILLYIRKRPLRSLQYFFFFATFPSFLLPSDIVFGFPLNRLVPLLCLTFAILPSLASYLWLTRLLIQEFVVRVYHFVVDRITGLYYFVLDQIKGLYHFVTDLLRRVYHRVVEGLRWIFSYIRHYPLRSVQYLSFAAVFPSYILVDPEGSILSLRLNEAVSLGFLSVAIAPSLISYLIQWVPFIARWIVDITRSVWIEVSEMIKRTYIWFASILRQVYTWCTRTPYQVIRSVVTVMAIVVAALPALSGEFQLPILYTLGGFFLILGFIQHEHPTGFLSLLVYVAAGITLYLGLTQPTILSMATLLFFALSILIYGIGLETINRFYRWLTALIPRFVDAIKRYYTIVSSYIQEYPVESVQISSLILAVLSYFIISDSLVLGPYRLDVAIAVLFVLIAVAPTVYRFTRRILPYLTNFQIYPPIFFVLGVIGLNSVDLDNYALSVPLALLTAVSLSFIANSFLMTFYDVSHFVFVRFISYIIPGITIGTILSFASWVLVGLFIFPSLVIPSDSESFQVMRFVFLGSGIVLWNLAYDHRRERIVNAVRVIFKTFKDFISQLTIGTFVSLLSWISFGLFALPSLIPSQLQLNGSVRFVFLISWAILWNVAYEHRRQRIISFFEWVWTSLIGQLVDFVYWVLRNIFVISLTLLGIVFFIIAFGILFPSSIEFVSVIFGGIMEDRLISLIIGVFLGAMGGFTIRQAQARKDILQTNIGGSKA